MRKENIDILHVVSSLNIGGAERFVIDLGEQQLKKYRRVAILSFGGSEEPLVKIAQSKGIEVISIGNASSVLGQLSIVKAMWAFKIIHIHTSYALKTLSIAIKLIPSKICIYTRHGAAPLSSQKWQNIHNNFRKYITSMTFVSLEAKDVFCNTYPWPEISKTVVDNGVVLPEEKTLVEKDICKLRLGSVGRLVPLKHQVCLLKAISQLPSVQKEQVEVNIYGDGECRSALEAFSNENNLVDIVNFHGMVTNREQVYSSIDLLVVTSETEGLSLAIMEAMAFSIPVYATNVGGNGYLLNEEKNGRLFDYDNDTFLASLISHALEQREELQQQGELGRRFIIQNYSINVACDNYDKLYTS